MGNLKGSGYGAMKECVYGDAKDYTNMKDKHYMGTAIPHSQKKL